jgi:hypothetical protein
MAESLGAIPVVTLELIQQSIMRARLAANADRKLEACKRLDYYKGDQLGHLDDVLREQFAHPEKLRLQKQFTNVVRRIINEVSVVYKRPPQRRLMRAGKPVEGPAAEAFQKLYEGARADAVMKKANRYTNLLQTIGLQVVWRNDRVELDILTPDILNVVQDPRDPTVAAAVVIEQAFADTVALEGPSNPYGARKLYIAWTPERHQVFDDQGTMRSDLANDAGNNPYKHIPIVWLRNEFPDGYFWNEGGQDLMNAQDAINVKLTYLNQLLKMQAFSIPVLVGEAPKGGITIDPSVYLEIPLADSVDRGQPDFKFVSPNPKIAEVLEAFKEDVRRICDDWGLSPESFKLSGTPSSGLSLKIQNIRLLERREDDVQLYADYERELFRVMRAVHNAHADSKQKLPEDAEIAVNFAELDFPEDPAAEDQRWVTRINQNVANRAQWLRAIDPDIKTDEEAEKRLKQNAELNSRTRGGFGAPGDLEKALGLAKEQPEDEEEGADGEA